MRTMGLGFLSSVVFYVVVGILFLVLLPFISYPPHIGLTGILSIITAYGLFSKRYWSIWLVVALFFVSTVFSLFTLYYTVGTDWLVSLGMIAYAVLSWLFTGYLLNNRKKLED